MLKFETIEGKNFGNIKLFTLSTCGWCRKTKAFFKEHDVAYSYVDVDLLSEKEMDEALKEQKKFNPRASYPTIVIDENRTIVGYDIDQLTDLVQGE
jgi:glutaredoxin